MEQIKTKVVLKFPNLTKASIKDVKDLADNDPRRGILVFNNVAIAFASTHCLCVDLMEYFTIEQGIEGTEEVAELSRILQFLDCKRVPFKMWEELTKGAEMCLEEGKIKISTPKFKKDLIYEEQDVDFIEVFSMLVKTCDQETGSLGDIALPFLSLKQIYDVLSTEFKHDKIILDIAGHNQPVKFTFRARKHFFGYIFPHYDSVQEGFRYDLWETWNDEVAIELSALKEKRKQEVPPPPPSQALNSEDDDSPNLFKVE